METEDWMRIKLPEEQTQLRLKRNASRKERTGRDMIFQTLLPCLLCFLIAYYIFGYRPQVAEFLCAKIVRTPLSHRHLPGSTNHPSAPKGDRVKV